MFKHFFSQIVKILWCVFILDCFDWEVDLLIKTISWVVLIVFWNSIVYLYPQSHASLISPTSRYILDGITSTSHHYGWQPKLQHIFQTLSMSLDTQIELPKFIITKTICPQLYNNCMWAILFHYSRHHIFKQMIVILIGYTRFERYIQRVVFAIVLPYLMQCPCSREEILAVLMEWNTHASVGEIKGLLHSVSMMYVDVQVEHSWVHLQQL